MVPIIFPKNPRFNGLLGFTNALVDEKTSNFNQDWDNYDGMKTYPFPILFTIHNSLSNIVLKKYFPILWTF